MPSGVYKLNKQFTPDQRQEDSIYGIYQNQNRTLQFVNQNFKFTYHYYYERENSSYQMVTQLTDDTVLTGTYHLQPNKIILTINHGEKKAHDKAKNENYSVTQGIKGTITVVENGKSLTIEQVKLVPSNMHRAQSMLSAGYTLSSQ